MSNVATAKGVVTASYLDRFAGVLVDSESDLRTVARDRDTIVEVVDQTVAGLNYITTRDRVEILKEYKNIFV